MRASEQKTSFIAKQIETLQRNYALMVGLILLFVVAVIWMIVSIVQTEDMSALTVQAQKHTTQLNPNLDRATLQLVSEKKAYSQEELTDFPIFILMENREGEYLVVPIEEAAERLEQLNNPNAEVDQEEEEEATTLLTLPSATPAASPTPAPFPIIEEPAN